jgi:hypothetical protein
MITPNNMSRHMISHRTQIVKETISDLLETIAKQGSVVEDMGEEMTAEMAEDAEFVEQLAAEETLVEEAADEMDCYDAAAEVSSAQKDFEDFFKFAPDLPAHSYTLPASWAAPASFPLCGGAAVFFEQNPQVTRDFSAPKRLVPLSPCVFTDDAADSESEDDAPPATPPGSPVPPAAALRREQAIQGQARKEAELRAQGPNPYWPVGLGEILSTLQATVEQQAATALQQSTMLQQQAAMLKELTARPSCHCSPPAQPSQQVSPALAAAPAGLAAGPGRLPARHQRRAPRLV